MSANIQVLAGVPLLKLLDEQEKLDLLRVLEQRNVPAGTKLFSIGEPGDSLYIVTAGRIELFVKDVTGSKIVLTVAAPGDVFGELSLFDGGARTATAVALEDSELLVLARQHLVQFLRRNPDSALDFLTIMGQRIRTADEMLRKTAARNINVEMEVRMTLAERIADLIAEFSGSIPFLMMNLLWFVIWILWNLIPGLPHFDPYPFSFLTMVVSLEAIFLSIFVLVSQSRQSAKDRLRAEADYQVNLKAELEIAHLHEKVDMLVEELLARMPRDERKPIKAMQ